MDFFCIDAMFAPVRKVNYSIGPARVLDLVDYDSLTLELWTNGGANPREVVGRAAKELSDQLSVFVNFDEELVPEKAAPPVLETKTDRQEVFLQKSIDEIELSVRAIAWKRSVFEVFVILLR